MIRRKSSLLAVVAFVLSWVFASSFFVSWQLSSSCLAAVTTRSSAVAGNGKGHDGYWVAVDFNVPFGKHVAAPVGKWSSAAPRFHWKNAKVLNVVWPKSETVAGENGYFRDFSVLFYLKHEMLGLLAEKVTRLSAVPESNNDVSCEIFYVLCGGGSCLPVTENVVIRNDGLLKQDEISGAIGIASSSVSYSFLLVLIMAFFGGLILNCMPCVFPILSIKIFSLLRHAGESERKNSLIQGVLFTVGTVTTFSCLGTILFVLKKAGENIGWGFYMQNPVFVLLLLLAFVSCALYFFEIFTFPAINFRNKDRGQYIQAFLNGVFTSVASGVCVGPFLGIVLSSALSYDSYLASLIVFKVLGIGVAAPFLAISIAPGINRFLPRPGAWMQVFRELMGFAMLISCVWLIYVLSCQIQMYNLAIIMAFCVCFAMSVWMFGKSMNSVIWKRISFLCMALSIGFMVHHAREEPTQRNHQQIAWEPFSFEKFEALKRAGKSVFINFTASWCLTCNLNKGVLGSSEVAEAFRKHGVVPLVADWTNRSDEIADALSMFGYNSIPLYVCYSPLSHRTTILPSLLRAGDIIKAVGG
jgi:thiol:disulfide interchange protein